MATQELKNRIYDFHAENFGVSPHFKTLGTDWNEGQAAYDELEKEGRLVLVKLPSKSGKRMMSKMVTDEQAANL